MAEYSRMAKGSFTSGASQTSAVINLPFTPDYVEVWNMTNIGAGAAANVICHAWWDNKASVTPSGKLAASTMTEGYNNSSALVYDTIALGGISSFQAALGQQMGANILLGSGGGIAQTSGTVLTVTTTAAHGLVPGNWVVFNNLYQTSTTGMQQIAGIPFEVLTTASTTTFTVGWVGNAANLTAITAGGYQPTAGVYIAGFKQILYPVLYAPGVAFPWTITLSGGVVTVNTTAAHNYVVGQEIAFRIPSIYGGTQLNSLPDLIIPGSPQYYYVTTVPSATSFTFNYSGSLTTFSVANPAFASFPGLKFAQVVAVGDVNTGGYPYTGAQLYPSPTVQGNNTLSATLSINGPAIQGAFYNNTTQGFAIGQGTPQIVTTGTTNTIVTASSVILWHAYQHDYANP